MVWIGEPPAGVAATVNRADGKSMGDRFLMRLDDKRRERWTAAAKALFLPLTTFIKAATDEKAEKVLREKGERLIEKEISDANK